jgi:hypothetical protein
MLHVFSIDAVIYQSQKIHGSEKNVSSVKLCRACYADYFGKKRFRVKSINDGAVVKNTQKRQLATGHQSGIADISEYFGHSTVIY